MEHSGESICTSPLTNRKTSGPNLTKPHVRNLPLGSRIDLMPVLRRLWVARFLAVTKLKAWAADTHNSKLTPGFVFRHQLELAVVCAQRSRNRMRRLIQSHSVVQRKSLSSFYHSSLSSLFSLLFCCFLPHFQQPIIPSLPHLLTLLPHVLCAPPILIPPPSLRLQIAYLHVCVWLCGRHPIKSCCARAHVCFFPASVSACICVLVKKACMVRVCVL